MDRTDTANATRQFLSAWEGWSFADAQQTIRDRHSVRRYIDRPLAGDVLKGMQDAVEEVNALSGLSCALVVDDSSAFDGKLAHYGSFRGVQNHIALIGDKGAGLHERIGFWGEQLALEAQRLGLNTCWVALTYKMGASVAPGPGQARPCVLALGYGETQGVPHTSKSLEKLSRVPGGIDAAPTWFRTGLEAAQLAPTSMNQQAFTFELLDEGCVRVRAGMRPNAKIDLGIVKCHFHLAASYCADTWRWEGTRR